MFKVIVFFDLTSGLILWGYYTAPAQLYIYMSNGMKFIDAFSVALINMGATLIYMPLAALYAILTLQHGLEPGVVPHLLRYGFIFFALFLTAFMMAFYKPELIGNLIVKTFDIIGRIVPSKRVSLIGRGKMTQANILKYRKVCRILLHENPWLFPLAILITVLLYLNKFCMQYIILLGLGVHADLVQVICVQILIQFMIYFAPTPGGSGFAELGIAVFFKNMLPSAVMPVFTVLQRSFILFFPAMVGAVFVINRLRKTARR